MHAGVQRQLRAGQIQRKQPLISPGGTAHAMTGAKRGHQHRCVRCHHTQAAPARHETGRLRSFEDPVVEPPHSRHVQMIAGLGERAIGHAARGFTAAQRGEDGIERGLLRARTHRQQCRDQRRER